MEMKTAVKLYCFDIMWQKFIFNSKTAKQKKAYPQRKEKSNFLKGELDIGIHEK